MRRQAIVFIHGINRRQSHGSLQQFADAVKQQLEQLEEEEKVLALESQPISVNGIDHGCRLTLPASVKRPATDFYEFSWQDNNSGSTFFYSVKWLWRLIVLPMWLPLFKWLKPSHALRKHRPMPAKLRPVKYLVFIFIIVVGIITLLLANQPLLLFLLAAGFLSVALAVNKKTGLPARYFSLYVSEMGPVADLRFKGLAFLKSLHNLPPDERPDRIIVVGHSLGSVIGYDLLQLLWSDYRRGSIDNWLITDFISLGSPLSSLDYYVDFHPSLNNQVKPSNNTELFNQVRWANIYYFTDFIGGPAAPLFGSRVTDIQIEKQAILPFLPWYHDNYWRPAAGDNRALEELVRAMRLV